MEIGKGWGILFLAFGLFSLWDMWTIFQETDIVYVPILLASTILTGFGLGVILKEYL